MDDDTLTQGMRGLVANCVREAAKRGTNVVGAEHVLLALAADTAAPRLRCWPPPVCPTAPSRRRCERNVCRASRPPGSSRSTLRCSQPPRARSSPPGVGRRGQVTGTSRAAGRAPKAFSRAPSAHRHPASGGRHRAARPVDRGHRSKRPHRRPGGAVTASGAMRHRRRNARYRLGALDRGCLADR